MKLLSIVEVHRAVCQRQLSFSLLKQRRNDIIASSLAKAMPLSLRRFRIALNSNRSCILVVTTADNDVRVHVVLRPVRGP